MFTFDGRHSDNGSKRCSTVGILLRCWVIPAYKRRDGVEARRGMKGGSGGRGEEWAVECLML